MNSIKILVIFSLLFSRGSSTQDSRTKTTSNSYNIKVQMVTLRSTLTTRSSTPPDYGWSDTIYPNGYRTDIRSGLCGTGRRQSPINIQNETVTESTKSVTFKNYNTFLLSGQISHTSYTVQFLINQTDPVKLNLNANQQPPDYKLRNIHFHWGCTEHHFNGISYALEVHLVHFKEAYEMANENGNQADFDISVVAVLYELSDTENEAVNTVLDMIREGSTYRGLDKKTVTYRDLLPKKLEHVYQYGGSLTTEPCNESVLWNVIASRNYISRRQLGEFQRLIKGVVRNCRVEQPLNNRIISRVDSIGFLDKSSAQVYRAYESLYIRITFIAVLILRPYLC